MIINHIAIRLDNGSCILSVAIKFVRLRIIKSLRSVSNKARKLSINRLGSLSPICYHLPLLEAHHTSCCIYSVSHRRPVSIRISRHYALCRFKHGLCRTMELMLDDHVLSSIEIMPQLLSHYLFFHRVRLLC